MDGTQQRHSTAGAIKINQSKIELTSAMINNLQRLANSSSAENYRRF
jgi:hypothetical protein